MGSEEAASSRISTQGLGPATLWYPLGRGSLVASEENQEGGLLKKLSQGRERLPCVKGAGRQTSQRRRQPVSRYLLEDACAQPAPP